MFLSAVKRNPLLRKTLAKVSAWFYGNPQDCITSIGITGTNGKTTVSYLVRSILREAGFPTGLIGTTGYWIDDQTKISPPVTGKTPVTTPDPWVLYSLLREMKCKGVKFCVMEVSSFGLKFWRVYGIPFKVAVLTNITPCHHLQIHGGFTQYIRDKQKLFTMLNNQSVAVLPRESSYFSDFSQSTKARVISYGLGPRADISGKIVEENISSLNTTIKTPKGEIFIKLPFPGEFNLKNSLAAVGAGVALNINLSVIKRGLENSHLPPGHWEIIIDKPFTVVVDKANTPQAFHSLINLVQKLKVNKKIVVYGNFSEFPYNIRQELARLTTDFFDLTIVTVDDSINVAPQRGINDFLEYVHRKKINPDKYLAIPERKLAIQRAVQEASAGDIILILGRGSEETMLLGKRVVKFNDITVTKNILREQGYL